MGTAPERNPGSTVKCLYCGRQNPVGRLYCQFCKQRLPNPPTVGLTIPVNPVAPIVDPPTVDPIVPVGPSEVEPLPATVKAAQDENLTPHRPLEPTQEELNSLKAASVPPEHSPEHVAELTSSLKAAEDKAANLQSHAEGWKDKWKSAEEKAAALEAKLVAKAKELEEFFKRDPKVASVDPGHVTVLASNLQTAEEKAAGLQSHAADLESKLKSAEQKAAALEAKLAEVGKVANPQLKYIFGIITFLGSLGGYGAGRYVQPKNDSGAKVNQLTTEVTNAQQQIGELTSELKSANTKADQAQNQAKADLDSANQQNSELAAHQQQVQHQLKDAAQKASIADQTQKQLRQDLDSANRKISGLTTSEQQLQRELADANAQKTSANQTVAQLNAEIARQHAQIAQQGSLVWSGNLTGKRTINIKNGVPDFGAVSGALPQKPCIVSTHDASVKIKNRPSKNHLNDLSFEVSGSGLVQVRIDWEISQ
jgi:hypothetical protein